VADIEMTALPTPPVDPSHIDAQLYLGTYALADADARFAAIVQLRVLTTAPPYAAVAYRPVRARRAHESVGERRRSPMMDSGTARRQQVQLATALYG
jgi:hypothetical protein